MMANVKPWYLSRTIWASIVAVLTGGAGLAGLPMAGADDDALVDSLLQAVGAVAGVVAVFGRLSAKHRIG